MAGKLPGGGELTELVADHILGDIDGHMLAAVVDGEGVADEFREDGGGAAPGLDDALLASGKMVEARLQVLTTLFLPLSFMASTFFIREGRT